MHGGSWDLEFANSILGMAARKGTSPFGNNREPKAKPVYAILYPHRFSATRAKALCFSPPEHGPKGPFFHR
jgi:hypothetical protein